MWIKLFSRKVELLILLLSLTVIYGCSEDIGSKKSRAIIENPELKKVISKYLNKGAYLRVVGGLNLSLVNEGKE